ncbi:MAG: arginine--tRNA ligase [Planctomycetes bacterium]|nr:arginine--tRNA ligase [Planctomycetota bacterium]
MNLLAELRRRFRPALAHFTADVDPLLDMIRPSQPQHGDYQANCAMPLQKIVGRPPREVAQQLIERLELDDLCEAPTIAGPGFINLRLKDAWLAEQAGQAVRDERIGVAPAESPRTYVIDYSAPNVAKPMHVGHIRSTVIGDALYRTLGFLGHRVISDNHLGDWGKQFGMVIYGYKHFRDEARYQDDPVTELARLYQLVHQIIEHQAGKPTRGPAPLDQLPSLSEPHPNLERRVLDETARLHRGEEENLRLWKEFMPACLSALHQVYDRLGVRFDHELGESYYDDRLSKVVEDVQAKGVAEESEGAICIFIHEFPAPMIIRKSDGSFLYATTDLATIQYRMETWRPDAILYVVDHRQSEHFEKLFAAARLWGYSDVELMHVSFGTVMGEDKRPFKAREGDPVGLESLLDEAVERAYRLACEIDEKKPEGPQLSEAERREVAEVVGIGALKYADLSQNRTSDYVFSFDKMCALDGNTAPYMQMAYTRVCGIYRKGGVDISTLRDAETPIVLSHPAERQLAVALLRYSEALDEVVKDYRPSQLTSYLFDLAKTYSGFFESCPVLKAETEELRRSRLLLCDLTARTIKQGLDLLGIGVVDKM